MILCGNDTLTCQDTAGIAISNFYFLPFMTSRSVLAVVNGRSRDKNSYFAIRRWKVKVYSL